MNGLKHKHCTNFTWIVSSYEYYKYGGYRPGTTLYIGVDGNHRHGCVFMYTHVYMQVYNSNSTVQCLFVHDSEAGKV